MSDERLTEDQLFLAFTRPAMILGVPVEAMVANMMITGVLYIGGNNFFFLLAAPVLHLVFREICRHDHNQFRVLFVWLNTKARARNASLWGGSSVSPLKVIRRNNAKDLI